MTCRTVTRPARPHLPALMSSRLLRGLRTPRGPSRRSRTTCRPTLPRLARQLRCRLRNPRRLWFRDAPPLTQRSRTTRLGGSVLPPGCPSSRNVPSRQKQASLSQDRRLPARAPRPRLIAQHSSTIEPSPLELQPRLLLRSRQNRHLSRRSNSNSTGKSTRNRSIHLGRS